MLNGILALFDTYSLVEAVCGSEFRVGATNKMFIMLCDFLSQRVDQLLASALRFDRQLTRHHNLMLPQNDAVLPPISQFSNDFIE